MDYHKRKPNRLKDFDYSGNGAYFVTLCTKERQRIFWNVGANCVRPDKIPLSGQGLIAENEIKRIDMIYEGITIDKYVIMPEHIHLIISICNDGRTQFAPTVSRVIKQFKGAVSKKIGYSVWQKSYFDHIIRNEQDYAETLKYIENNPQKWLLNKGEQNESTNPERAKKVHGYKGNA